MPGTEFALYLLVPAGGADTAGLAALCRENDDMLET
jgi:hypothetical protein